MNERYFTFTYFMNGMLPFRIGLAFGWSVFPLTLTNLSRVDNVHVTFSEHTEFLGVASIVIVLGSSCTLEVAWMKFSYLRHEVSEFFSPMYKCFGESYLLRLD